MLICPMSIDKDRLLLELSKTISDINYDITDPSIPASNLACLCTISVLISFVLGRIFNIS